MDDLYPTVADLRHFYIKSEKKTVFYSSGAPLSEAENAARTYNKRIYLNCWPPGYLKKRSNNRWRYRVFVQSFSRVLAQEATGMAWVVAPPSPGNPKQWLQPSSESVWTNQELPALLENPKINQILWVSSCNVVRSHVISPRPCLRCNLSSIPPSNHQGSRPENPCCY